MVIRKEESNVNININVNENVNVCFYATTGVLCISINRERLKNRGGISNYKDEIVSVVQTVNSLFLTFK